MKMTMGMAVSIPSVKNLSGYFSSPEDNLRHPGLILIHEVWGLGDHIKDVANRFAEEGYAVLAPDLLSETGIIEKVDQKILEEIRNPITRDEAQKKLRAAMAPIISPDFAKSTVGKLKACVDYMLENKKVNDKIAVIGFCFGGTYAYALAAEDNRIQAAVPFYGHAPEPIDRIKNISCPILAFYGEQDHNLVDSLPDLESKMKEHGKNFTYKIYPNTGHAFFNDTNLSTYNKDAATDAWRRTILFLKQGHFTTL